MFTFDSVGVYSTTTVVDSIKQFLKFFKINETSVFQAYEHIKTQMNGGNAPTAKLSGWLENSFRKTGHRLPTPIFCMNSKWRVKVCSKNNFKNTIWCLHISFYSFFHHFSGCAALDVYIILAVFLLICQFTSLYWSKEQSMPLCHQLRQIFACQFAEQFASRIFYPHFGNAFLYISARIVQAHF